MTVYGPPPPNNDEDQKQLQAQLEAQAQAQAELQAQLQGQGQGEHQSQSQHQSSENCNVNGNVNYDANSNENANCNVNANYNTSVTTVCVDVKVSDQISDTPQHSAPDIDLSALSISDNKGVVNLMPEDNNQVINGDSGGVGQNNVIFHLDQVNNLVNNGHLEGSYSNASTIGNFGSLTGGATSNGTGPVTGSDFAQSLDHAGSNSVDGIAQSITLGANVQINQQTFTGHDSVVADHNSTAHHDGA